MLIIWVRDRYKVCLFVCGFFVRLFFVWTAPSWCFFWTHIDYIQNYVWASGQGLFYYTQRVLFNARDSASIPSPAPTTVVDISLTSPPTTVAVVDVSPTSPPKEETTQRVMIESVIDYTFFDSVKVREPTTEEVQALMTQTNLFYAEVLQAAYPGKRSSRIQKEPIER